MPYIAHHEPSARAPVVNAETAATKMAAIIYMDVLFIFAVIAVQTTTGIISSLRFVVTSAPQLPAEVNIVWFPKMSAVSAHNKETTGHAIPFTKVTHMC